MDAALGAKLDAVPGAVELCDESGRTLGYFHPLPAEAHPSGRRTRSPFSDEDIERRRQEKGGRPLAEILADLNRQ